MVCPKPCRVSLVERTGGLQWQGGVISWLEDNLGLLPCFSERAFALWLVLFRRGNVRVELARCDTVPAGLFFHFFPAPWVCLV